MAKCRYCSKSGWAVRTNQDGLCRACSASIQRDVDSKLDQLKKALLYVRCSSNPESQLAFCDTALSLAEKLALYEKRRLAEVRPKPAAVIDMLNARREEVLALCGAVQPRTRRVKGAYARLSNFDPPPRKSGAPTAAAALEPTPEVDGSTPGSWWAWGSSVPDPFDGSVGEDNLTDHRGTGRTSVDCYALLNPGGVRGRLENLSSGGLFLRAGQVRPEGSAVRIIVSTPHGPATAEGVVRWARGATPEDGGPAGSGMGIQFTNVSQELLSFLASCLALPRGGIGSEETLRV